MNFLPACLRDAPAPGDVGLDDVAALALEQLPEPVARVLVLARRDQQEISSDQDSKHAVYAAGTVTVNDIVSLQCAVKLKLCKFNLSAKNI